MPQLVHGVRLDPDSVTHLVEQAQGGSREALGLLYDHFTGPVWNHIHRRSGGDRALTDDVHADVWEVVLRKIATFDATKGRFVYWLFSIADRRAIDLARRAGANRSNRELQAHMLMYGSVDKSLDPSPEAEAESRESAELVLRFVRALPRRQQEAVLLTVFDGLSSVEAAEVLGISASALRIARHKGLTTLRKKLGPLVRGNGSPVLHVHVAAGSTAAEVMEG